MNDIAIDKEHLHYLEQLSEMYPTIGKASSEIINLQAILNLPKGTEHFVSDVHGEYEAFSHVLKNGSGAVRKKIDDVFGLAMNKADKAALATLIYYPREKMELIKQDEPDMDSWYKTTLYKLIEVCKTVNQCGICSRTNRDPLIFAPGTGVGIARIDDDHAGIRFLACLFKIVSHPTATHSRFARVITKQHYQFTVFDIRRAVTICPAAVGIVQTFRNLRGRVVTVMVQITAAAVHQARDQGISRRPRAGHGAAQRTGAIVQIDGFVAVLFDQALHIGRDDVVGFFPANALPFVRTWRTIFRVAQTVFAVDVIQQTGPFRAQRTTAYRMIRVTFNVINRFSGVFRAITQAIHQ